MIRPASRRVGGRSPVAPLPASGPQREQPSSEGHCGTRGDPPGKVCNFKLPKVSSFKLPLTTITFVGTLEPFYWETAAYVEALRDAGVEVAFKEYKDCFHGFERIAGDTEIGKDGQIFTYDNYAEFYDRYVA